MNTLEAQFPPLAQALGRLRQPDHGPAAARALALLDETPAHDLLRLMPEPALAADLPGLAAPQARALPARIPGPEAARTYWFDL